MRNTVTSTDDLRSISEVKMSIVLKGMAWGEPLRRIVNEQSNLQVYKRKSNKWKSSESNELKLYMRKMPSRDSSSKGFQSTKARGRKHHAKNKSDKAKTVFLLRGVPHDTINDTRTAR
jgi:hypothetical protein